MTNLPDDFSDLDVHALHRTASACDERMSPLFQRWPRLSVSERRDLDRLWSERLRVAKKLGGLRRARRRAA